MYVIIKPHLRLGLPVIGCVLNFDSRALPSRRADKRSLILIETPSTAFLMVSWLAVLLVGRWASPIIKDTLINVINNNQYCYTISDVGHLCYAQPRTGGSLGCALGCDAVVSSRLRPDQHSVSLNN